MGVGHLLTQSARIFFTHWFRIFVVGVLIYGPIEILMLQVQPNEPDPIKADFEAMQLQSVIDLLLGMIAVLYVIHLTAGTANKRTIFRSYLRAVPTAIASSLVLAGLFLPVLLGAGLRSIATSDALRHAGTGLAILLAAPGVAGFVYLTFYLQVPALKEESGFTALKTSKRLIEGHFWRLAAYNLLLGGGATLLLEAPAFFPLPPAASVCVSVVADIASLYFTVAFTVLYLHLEKTRFD